VAQGKDLEIDLCEPGFGHCQLLSRGVREVDDAAFVHQVAAVSDANYHGSLVGPVTTRTREPKGRVGWQAVMAYISKSSPLAVLRPLKTPPYQEARPCILLFHCAPGVLRGRTGAQARQDD